MDGTRQCHDLPLPLSCSWASYIIIMVITTLRRWHFLSTYCVLGPPQVVSCSSEPPSELGFFFSFPFYRHGTSSLELWTLTKIKQLVNEGMNIWIHLGSFKTECSCPLSWNASHRKLISDSFKTCTPEKLFALGTECVLFWFIKTKAV